MAEVRSLAAWSAAHHGVVTWATLGRLGLSPQRVETLVAGGFLRREAPAVYVVTAAPATTLQRLAVASADTDGAVSAVAAGTAWEYRKLPRNMLVDVTIDHRRRLDIDALPPRIRLHRSRSLAPTDLVRRADGTVLTSPPRTVFDLAAVLDRDSLESVIEQGIDREHFGVPTLWATARRLAKPGRAGAGSSRCSPVDRHG